MNIHELVTKSDIEKLRREILEAINERLRTSPVEEKKWLRSKEVRKMLNISDGTLLNLRVKGLLHGTKINGLWYYQQDEIQALLNAGKE